ncbi:hypothetical protein ACFWYW_14625 [Nonomuraea sp. NPDC059023]|uniref:hypothetical protein n=1 Tax=unclassified Nonomuraea TaxID=2593643 RepID=UPI0036A1DE7B
MASNMGFDIFARDQGASKTFERVGDAAERLGRRLDGIGRISRTVRGDLAELGRSAADLGGGLSAAGRGVTALGSQLASLGASTVGTAARLGVTAAALATFGAGAVSAAGSALSLAAALAPAAGAIAALPGGALLGAAAMATLKIATAGVGEAFAAALGPDYEAFLESVAGLSPAASAAAFELNALYNPIQQLRAAVQEAFFQPLLGQVTQLGVLIGPLRDGMSSVAEALGEGARELAEFASSGESLRAVESVFSSLHRSVTALVPAAGPLLAGFRDLGVLGAGWLADLSPGIALAVGRLGEFIANAVASGEALQWMDNALIVLRALGSIAADVGRLLGGLFDAIRSAGGNALGVLGQLIDAFSEWVNSAEGQDVLVDVFRALGDIGRALWPVLRALAGALALIAPQAAGLALAIGPGLTSLIGALGAAVAALGPGLITVADALARAFANPQVAQGLLALGQGISSMLIALAPLIPPAVELAAILVERWGTGLTLLARLLEPVTSALSGILLPILPQLSQLLREAAEAVLPLAGQLGDQLALALRDTSAHLGPLNAALREVGGEVLAALRDALPQVTPHLGNLARGFAALFVEIVKLLPDLVRLGGDVLVLLIQQTPQLVPAVTDLALACLELFRQAAPLVPMLLQLLVEIIRPLIPELPKLLPPFTDLVRILADLTAQATPLIAKFLESPEALAAIKIFSSQGVLFLNTLARSLELVVGLAQLVIGAFLGLPDQANAGMARVGSALKGWLNDVIGWIERIMNIVADLVPGAPRVSLPRLADGAIIHRQTLAVVGEAGPEVVLPLTRPARAAELARRSGLLDLLANAPGAGFTDPSVRDAALGPGRFRPLPLVAGGGGVTFVFHFNGQPLVSREEISRLVIAALAEARSRGFNLGFATS